MVNSLANINIIIDNIWTQNRKKWSVVK